MDSTPDGAAAPEDARIDETYELHKTLTEDLMAVLGPAKAGDQAARRAYVRAAFALIDGMTFRMKATALTMGGGSFSPGEQALLQEREYFLSEAGGVETRKARINTLKNLRFTFAMLVKAGTSEWSPAYGGDGWSAMRAAIAVRDQLTHPKSVADLHVGDEQLAQSTRAVTWFTSSLLKIMFGIAEAQRKKSGRTVELSPILAEHIEHIEKSAS